MSEPQKISIIDHLTELREKIILCLIVWFLGCIIVYICFPIFSSVILKPITNLYFINPLDAMMFKINIILSFGFILALPVFIFELICFIFPALKKSEKKYLLIILPLSLFLFILGGIMAIKLIIPFGIRFLLGFSTEGLQPMISIKEYYRFFINTVLACCLVFETPVLLMFLAVLGLVNSKMLRKKWGIAVLLIFIISAVITPSPDAFTLLLIAGPMVILYEASIWLIKIFERKS